MAEDNRYSGKSGPYKEKAEDFKNMKADKLLEKYPNDSELLNALATRSAAVKLAETTFSTDKEAARFIEGIENRIADNIEHGRIEEMKVKKYGQEQER